MNDSLRSLTDAGVLADIDRYFGESMLDLGATPEVALWAAAASAMYRAGHVCLPFDQAGERVADVVAAADGTEPTGPATLLCLPSADIWRDALVTSPVVVADGSSAEPRPLVVDQERLYLHRLHRAECRLAEQMLERARRRSQVRAEDPAAVGVEHVPADAAQATMNGLCIVTGGPGTGKTTLAAHLIEYLIATGKAKPSRIGLAAPSGKAATRLQEAVRSETVRAGFQPSASTIHRLLTHSALPLDALVVDECSMVDLALMTKLIEALPDACRLILLGDAEQLASVEPGSVFGDLCSVPDDSPLSECIVRLEESHRFDPSKGIGRLADAAVRGDAEAALQTLRHDGDGETCLTPLTDEAAFDAFARSCADEWGEHIQSLRENPEGPAFPPRRVLCAHRRGAYGMNRFNSLVQQRLRAAGAIDGSEFFIGRPIIVTRNDRHTGLSNGDTGVVVEVEGRLQVRFPELTGPDGPLLVSPYRLPRHESFFALTVHRAQGSEYDEVLVVPGDAKSRLCTRELFYTAISRARHHVTVLAQDEAVTGAVRRTTVRHSGLGLRLNQPAGS